MSEKVLGASEEESDKPKNRPKEHLLAFVHRSDRTPDIISATFQTPSREVFVYGGATAFTQEVIVGPHQLSADEPKDVGGNDEGPTPYDLLLAGLGSCTSITVAIYAQRKGWPLQGVSIRLRHSRIHTEDCAECETQEGKLDQIELDIEFHGALSEEQRSKLVEIAKKCPVHRTLTTENVIRTRAVPLIESFQEGPF